MKTKSWLATLLCVLFCTAAWSQNTQTSTSEEKTTEQYLAEVDQLMREQKFDELFKVLDKLIELNPNDTQHLFMKGYLAGKLGRWEEALKACDQLIELQPDDGNHWVMRGQILSRLGRDQEALGAFEKATVLCPRHEAAWNNRGGLLLKFGKLDEALESYGKAIELRPEWADSFYNRACVYARKGDKANALADLKRAIELEPAMKPHASNDEDFKSLRSNPDFQNLVFGGWHRSAPNITLKVVKVDSEETVGEDGKAANAVDGQPFTFWHTQWQGGSPGHPHEIVIELDPASTIKGFTYLPRQDESDHGTIKDYEVFVSDDSVDFGAPVAKGSFTRDKQMKTVTFDAKPCRFVKLKALSEVNGQPVTSAAEIDVIAE